MRYAPTNNKCTLALAAAMTLFAASPAHAWSIGNQLDYEGCHERITAEALRIARDSHRTAPVIKPTRDEAALIDTVQFEPPSDFVQDLGGMALLLAVRDNDLKGNNPLDSIDIVQVHGNPHTQDEHCIRGPNDDGDAGNESALAACRAFIVQRATDALAGLAADGTVDASRRMPLEVYVSFAGDVDPELPMFYVRMGQALHALQDGFTHTYRNSDGSRVTYVLNWIDNVKGDAQHERRDGPEHLAGLDACDKGTPLVMRNFRLAREATTALLSAALDASLSADAKIAAFETVTTTYLSYQPGCSIDNNYCDAAEPEVPDPTAGCNATDHRHMAWPIAFWLVAIGARRRQLNRRRGSASSLVPVAGAALLAVLCIGVAPSAADPSKQAPQTEPGFVEEQAGKEPGRDVNTPTPKDVAEVRKDKQLGSPFGFATSVGSSVVHGAANVTMGVRYRLAETWLIGADVEWNPWFTSVPLEMKSGVGSAYATLIRRFPMKFDRVNLRTSLHAGASTLLFDVNGAPKYSVGPFVSFAPLGIDYDLGKAVRLVIDPVEIALPMPHVGLLPLYYEQFRLMIGLQIGA